MRWLNGEARAQVLCEMRRQRFGKAIRGAVVEVVVLKRNLGPVLARAQHTPTDGWMT